MRIKEIQNFDPYDLINFLNQEAVKEYQKDEKDYFNAGMAFMLACVRKYFNDSFDIPIRDNNGWISVDDELPKQNGFYLVCYDREFHGGSYFKKIDVVEFCQAINKFNFYHDFITHWQYLPRPPKELTNETA